MPLETSNRRFSLEKEAPRSKLPPPGPTLDYVQCNLCPSKFELGAPNVQAFQHWKEKHGGHPASLKMTRESDKTILNLKDIYKYVFKCDAPGCTFWSVSNISDKDCVKKIREHWSRAHNVDCTVRCSPVTCLGYMCGTCHEVIVDKQGADKHCGSWWGWRSCL